MLDSHAAPGRSELDAALDRLRGEIELPIPAASAVKIGGERAYSLARRGVVVEMPVRRSFVYESTSSRTPTPQYGSTCGSAPARMCARSRRRSAATAPRYAGSPSGRSASRGGGGRLGRADAPVCGARPALRRPPRARARDSARRCSGTRTTDRRRGRMTIANDPAGLERRPRAIAIGTFDGVHLGHQAVIEAAVATGEQPTVVTFDPHPRTVLGNRVELLATRNAAWSCSRPPARRTSWSSSSRRRSQRSSPRRSHVSTS